MLVRRIGLYILLGFIFTLSACAKDPLDGIFPSSNQNNSSPTDQDACVGSALVKNRFIVQWTDGHTTVEGSENAALFKENFLRPQLSKITHVEFDQLVHVHSATVSTASASNTWGQDIIQASSAWNSGANGQGILVGVVDAAVDYTHPQIQPRLAANTAEIKGKAGIDDDGNGFIDDFYGWDFENGVADPHDLIYPLPTDPNAEGNFHGTHVSGIIAADHNKGPMQGMAPQAQIVPANFMDETGSGSLGAGIQAIQYVASRGVKVINASWGGPICSQSLKTAVNNLAAKNILFVVASGNDGLDLDSNPDYPANFNFPNQITVAASNASDFLTSWSNTSFNLVHVGAPGDTIYSTIPAGYGLMSGTSMATPFVSGTAALLWSLRPNATYAQIKQAIMDGAESKGYRVKTQGRINISNSIQALKKALP